MGNALTPPLITVHFTRLSVAFSGSTVARSVSGLFRWFTPMAFTRMVSWLSVRLVTGMRRVMTTHVSRLSDSSSARTISRLVSASAAAVTRVTLSVVLSTLALPSVVHSSFLSEAFAGKMRVMMDAVSPVCSWIVSRCNRRLSTKTFGVTTTMQRAATSFTRTTMIVRPGFHA